MHTRWKKLRHKQGGSHQGTTPKLTQRLKVIQTKKKKERDGHSVCSFTLLINLHSHLLTLPEPVFESLSQKLNFNKQKKNSYFLDKLSLALLHTSALLQPVSPIDPLTFLLLTDLNVLLNVHSWRGRDRHS